MRRGWVVAGTLVLVAVPSVPVAATGVSLVLHRVGVPEGVGKWIRTGDVQRFRVRLHGSVRGAKVAVAAAPAEALLAVACTPRRRPSQPALVPPGSVPPGAPLTGPAAPPPAAAGPAVASAAAPGAGATRSTAAPADVAVAGARMAVVSAGARAARELAARALDVAGRGALGAVTLPGAQVCSLRDVSGRRAVDVTVTAPEGASEVTLAAVARLRATLGGDPTTISKTTTTLVTDPSGTTTTQTGTPQTGTTGAGTTQATVRAGRTRAGGMVAGGSGGALPLGGDPRPEAAPVEGPQAGGPGVGVGPSSVAGAGARATGEGSGEPGGGPVVREIRSRRAVGDAQIGWRAQAVRGQRGVRADALGAASGAGGRAQELGNGRPGVGADFWAGAEAWSRPVGGSPRSGTGRSEGSTSRIDGWAGNPRPAWARHDDGRVGWRRDGDGRVAWSRADDGRAVGSRADDGLAVGRPGGDWRAAEGGGADGGGAWGVAGGAVGAGSGYTGSGYPGAVEGAEVLRLPVAQPQRGGLGQAGSGARTGGGAGVPWSGMSGGGRGDAAEGGRAGGLGFGGQDGFGGGGAGGLATGGLAAGPSMPGVMAPNQAADGPATAPGQGAGGAALGPGSGAGSGAPGQGAGGVGLAPGAGAAGSEAGAFGADPGPGVAMGGVPGGDGVSGGAGGVPDDVGGGAPLPLEVAAGRGERVRAVADVEPLAGPQGFPLVAGGIAVLLLTQWAVSNWQRSRIRRKVS